MSDLQHLLVRSTRRSPTTKVARVERNVMRRSRVLLDDGFPLSKSAGRFTEIQVETFLANRQNLLDSMDAGLLEFYSDENKPMSREDLMKLGAYPVAATTAPDPVAEPAVEQVTEPEPPVSTIAAEPVESVQAEPTSGLEPPQQTPEPTPAIAEDKAKEAAEVPGKRKGRRPKGQQESA